MIRAMLADFGARYIVACVLFFGCVKGLAGGLLRGLVLPYFQGDLQASMADYHRIFTIIVLLPFCVKPAFGICSDLLPIGGYRKRWYLRVFGVMTAGTLAWTASHPVGRSNSICALTTASLGIVGADLLMEASYSEALRDRSILSGNMVVLMAWGMCIAGLGVAAVTAGTMADAGLAREAFGIGAIPALVFACSAAMVPEAKVVLSWFKFQRHIGQVVLSLILTTGACVTTVAMFHIDPSGQAGILAGTLVAVFVTAWAVLPATLFWCNLFMFIADASSLNFVGATDYFYTSDCDNTPNFTFTFYTTCSMLVSSVFCLLGIVLFYHFQHLPIKLLFAWLTVARVIAASVEVLQAARLNLHAGIGDHTFYILGEAAVQPAVSMMFAIPMILLTSRLVDRGSEAMSYAILAGTQNLGCLVASLVGQWATAGYDIQGCDFHKLPGALVLGHMALPLVCVPLAFLMLPDTALSNPVAASTRRGLTQQRM